MKHILLFLLLSCSALAELIPAARLADWTPSTKIGVIGGIDQYRVGGANQRTTLLNVVTTYSADNTGATNAYTAIASAVTAAGANEVVYLPIGVYKVNSTITTTHKKNFTIRGAGSYTTSTSSVALGSGAKTFTVPASLGYTAGVGVYVWRRSDPRDFMRGTVTSYSGTTLVIDSTETAGSGTYTDWKVSLTLLDTRAQSSAGIRVGYTDNDYLRALGDNNWENLPTLTGTYSKGATSITVSSLTSAYWNDSIAVNSFVQIGLVNEQNNAAIQAGAAPVVDLKGYTYSRRQMSRVTAVADNVITISPGLYYDITATTPGSIYKMSDYGEKVGVEDLAIMGDSGNSPNLQMYQQINSWFYNVDAEVCGGYNVQFALCLNSEIRKSWGFCNISGGGTNGAGLLVGSANTACLVEDNVFGWQFPCIEVNTSAVGSAFLYNYLQRQASIGSAQLNTNHAAHNSYNLYEGNLAGEIKSDGYFGSESEQTYFRNYVFNNAGEAYIAVRRLSRNTSVVGNVVGQDGVANSNIGYGNPNLTSGASNGTATPSAGDFWLHWKAQATLDIRTSDSEGVWSPTVLTGSNYQNPDVLDSTWFPSFYWSGGRRVDMTSVSVVGDDITVSGGNLSVLPATTTVATIWPGSSGFQEIDADVNGTKIQKGNYIVTAGTGAQENNLSGDTIPNSLAYAATPSWWPSSLVYPPVNPASPDFDHDIIPAGYRYLNGVDPANGGGSVPTAPSTLSATAVSTSQINLTWADNSSDETSFRLERRIGAGAWGTVTSPAANATSYSNTGLTASTTYDYRIYAVNAAGDSTVSNTASATTQSEGGGTTIQTLNIGTLNIQ